MVKDVAIHAVCPLRQDLVAGVLLALDPVMRLGWCHMGSHHCGNRNHSRHCIRIPATIVRSYRYLQSLYSTLLLDSYYSDPIQSLFQVLVLLPCDRCEYVFNWDDQVAI
jgi:hypothetical protein